MASLLLEGPFETDYSLAIVNRRLAVALHRAGVELRLHQRDNTTAYFPSPAFLDREAELAPLFTHDPASQWSDIHSRYIYPPHTDKMRGRLHAVHCYGWEESVFPRQFVDWFNDGVGVVTVMSRYVRDVLAANGVLCEMEVCGLGADHILEMASKPVEVAELGTFDFLHVSSCFPRKGVDVLLEAFCQEFRRANDVRLIIKTFQNPHNELDRLLADIDQRFPRHPPIKVIWRSLELGEMRHLYERAGALVAPSRGEGFGLPVAEAMALGTPVLATVYSGHADLCPEGTCWPIEFKLDRARTHLSEGRSVWAEPLVLSLREQMRSVYASSQQIRLHRASLARTWVLTRYTWSAVASRHMDACHESLRGGKRARTYGTSHTATLKLGMVTTWNIRCGIAEYSRYLANNLPPGVDLTIFAARNIDLVRSDEACVDRCWGLHNCNWIPREQEMRAFASAIVASGVEAVSIQYNFGFFLPSELAILFSLLREAGVGTILTMHSADPYWLPQMSDAFRLTDAVVCHKPADLEAFRSAGAGEVVLFKQGILTHHEQPAPRGPLEPFTVACFGFMLPQKGFYELIHAFALARNVNPAMQLKLINSLYPIPESASYANQCLELIQRKHLGAAVSITTDFLPDDEVLRELAAADLVVLPYLYSSESSSAAAAVALASLTPVLCSDLPIFDELGEAVHRFPSRDVFAMANRILDLSSNNTELHRTSGPQRDRVCELAWSGIAREFIVLANRIASSRRQTASAKRSNRA